MKTEHPGGFLAIDLGATSGRAIVGTLENTIIKLQEVNRFANGIVEVNGHSYWNLFHLYEEIIEALKIVAAKKIKISSIGIDTWGVDYVYFDENGNPLRMPFSYRDEHTLGAPERFFQLIEREKLYFGTGIQIMNFNTLFQLHTQHSKHDKVHAIANKILFMPDALSCLLTNRMVTEYTIASTSQMLNPFEKKFDPELLRAVGMEEGNLAPLVFPGTVIGKLTDAILMQVGSEFKDVKVVAVAGHDTASAVLAIPATDDNYAFLSSGTWSLMGIEIDHPIINNESFNLNFTNEGAADGGIRFLKNICGMWLIEQCKKEWERTKHITYGEIVGEAEKALSFRSFINPQATCFHKPVSMVEAIQRFCADTGQPIPTSIGEIARCIYESLAFIYKQTLEDIKRITNRKVEKLHIIGGGSNNMLLNQFTANALSISIEAGPSEATALGNIVMQAKAAGILKNKKMMRQWIRDSVKLETFAPQVPLEWQNNYCKFREIIRNSPE